MPLNKAVTRGLGVKTLPKIISNFLVRQFCLFVQQDIYGKKQSKIHAGMHKNSPFSNKKNPKFSGDGDTPSQAPPTFSTYGASIFSLMALQFNMTPPKNLSYSLAAKTRFTLLCYSGG